MISTNSRSSALVVALGAVLLSAPAQAVDGDFLKRFDGTFSGSGEVSRNEGDASTGVKCSMKGTSTSTAVSMSGTCRAAIIFSRKISAHLKVDESGRYTGTYVGSSIGPAALSGKRSGDSINLTITWPEEVRGDTTAQMTIRNDGNGQVAIIIADKMSAGGASAQVSSIALSGG